MPTWLPDELPAELRLPSDSAPVAPDGATVPPEHYGTRPLSQFGHPPAAYSQPPQRATPAIASKSGLTNRQAIALLGIVSLLVFVVRVGLYLRDANVDYSPLYVGAAVEQGDTSDGLTIVGVNDTVAYKIEPDWVDVFVDVEGTRLGELCNGGSTRVGGHLTGDPARGEPDMVIVCVFRDEFPRRSLADTHAEIFELGARSLNGTITQESRPIATANGLNGYQGVVQVESGGVASSSSLVVLGNGSNVVMLGWTTLQPAVDEVALRAFLNTIRIDE